MDPSRTVQCMVHWWARVNALGNTTRESHWRLKGRGMRGRHSVSCKYNHPPNLLHHKWAFTAAHSPQEIEEIEEGSQVHPPAFLSSPILFSFWSQIKDNMKLKGGVYMGWYIQALGKLLETSFLFQKIPKDNSIPQLLIFPLPSFTCNQTKCAPLALIITRKNAYRFRACSMYSFSWCTSLM